MVVCASSFGYYVGRHGACRHFRPLWGPDHRLPDLAWLMGLVGAS
jgi:hypothetical protein